MPDHNGDGEREKPDNGPCPVFKSDGEVYKRKNQGDQKRDQTCIITKTCPKIAPQQRDGGSLHAAARTIQSGQCFDGTGEKMSFEVIRPAQLSRLRFMKFKASVPTRMI